MEYHFSAPDELLGFLDETVGFLAVEERKVLESFQIWEYNMLIKYQYHLI